MSPAGQVSVGLSQQAPLIVGQRRSESWSARITEHTVIAGIDGRTVVEQSDSKGPAAVIDQFAEERSRDANLIIIDAVSETTAAGPYEVVGT